MSRTAYAWEINGDRVRNPDVFAASIEGSRFQPSCGPPWIFIDCPRGAMPGTARLLLTHSQAEALLASGQAYTITVRRYEDTGEGQGGSWQEREKWEFHGYRPLRMQSAADNHCDDVVLDLEDERHLWRDYPVRKAFNVVRYRGAQPEDDRYDLATLKEDQPFTYQEILADLLSDLAEPPELSLPSFGEEKPRNLVFTCSLADAVDQLLASLGFAIVFDPLASEERFFIVDLREPQNLTAIEGQKDQPDQQKPPRIAAVEQQSSEVAKPQKLLIQPFEIDSVRPFASLTEPLTERQSDGTGDTSLQIADHEFEPDTERIRAAVDAWYAPADDPRDETYHGIVAIQTGASLTRIRWSHAGGRTATRVVSAVPCPIPWPVRPPIRRVDGQYVTFQLNQPLYSAGSSAAASVTDDPSGEYNAGDSIQVTAARAYNADVGALGVAARRSDGGFTVIELEGDNGGGDGGGGTTPKPAFLVSAVIDTLVDGGYSGGSTVYGANSSSPNAAIKAAGQVVLSPSPYSIYTPQTSVANPFGLNGIDGDACLIGWDNTNAHYFLQEVYPAKAPFLFKVNTRPAGLGVDMSVEPKHAIGAGSGYLSVKDSGNVAINAKSGDTGFAVWSQEKNAFVCVWCERDATNIRGLTGNEVSGDVEITDAVGYDGDPPSGTVLGKLHADWEYPGSGKAVWAQLNPTNGEWDVYQMDCVPEEI